MVQQPRALTALDMVALSTYDGIQKWVQNLDGEIRSNIGSQDAVARATDGCCALLQHTAILFAAIEKALKATEIENINETYPRLGDFSSSVERLLKAADRVIPNKFAGGSGSRLEFVAGNGKEDPGQPRYFTHCPTGAALEHAVRCLPPAEFDVYFVCIVDGCNKGLKEWDPKDPMAKRTKHMENCHEGVDATTAVWDPMDAGWVLRQAKSVPAEVRPIFIYCLESPLCYRGNLAMRSVTGEFIMKI